MVCLCGTLEVGLSSCWRLIDGHTLVVESITGPGTWTRLTVVTEASSTVTIGVSSLRAPLPSTDVGIPVEFTVSLGEPIGDRVVIDASSGVPVPRD